MVHDATQSARSVRLDGMDDHQIAAIERARRKGEISDEDAATLRVVELYGQPRDAEQAKTALSRAGRGRATT